MLESNDFLIEKNYDLSQKLRKMKTGKTPKLTARVMVTKADRKKCHSRSPVTQRAKENSKKETQAPQMPKKKMAFSPKVKGKLKSKTKGLRGMRANMKSTPSNIEKLVFSPPQDKTAKKIHSSFNYYCSQVQKGTATGKSSNMSSIRGSHPKRVSVKQNPAKAKLRSKIEDIKTTLDNLTSREPSRFSHNSKMIFDPSKKKAKTTSRVSYGGNFGTPGTSNSTGITGQSPRNGIFSSSPYPNNPYFGLTFAPGNNGPVRGKF